MGEKERFEVLLEEVRGNVKQIAEGQVGLRQEMNHRFDSLYGALHGEILDLKTAFKTYAKQTDHRITILESKAK